MKNLKQSLCFGIAITIAMTLLPGCPPSPQGGGQTQTSGNTDPCNQANPSASCGFAKLGKSNDPQLADALRKADGGIQNAAALESGVKSAGMGGQAATAGLGVPNLGGSGNGNGGGGGALPTLPTLPSLASANQGTSGGFAAGSGSNPSSGGAGMGSLATSPASGGQAATGGTGTTPLGSGAGVTASEYAGSGGGKGSGGQNPFAAGLGGSGSGSGLSATSGTMDFKGQEADRTPASGSADPEDYFTRLNPTDNLFKVVERRYQHTTMAWSK